MKIGAFDSGIGGEAIAVSLKKLIPDADILSVNDHEHVPYGSRPVNEIIELTLRAVKPLIDAKCDAIVIACNTATTIAIETLRATYPEMKFVGIEPMVKPAATLTKTNVIAILATPATLKSARYNTLKTKWASHITIIEPDCTTWATLIENGRTNEIEIDSVIEKLLSARVDVIVLACTHYHWLIPQITDVVNGRDVKILEPSDAIASRIKQLLN